jgi:hypothetical protein
MKKITLILTTFVSIVSFSQQKSTGTISLSNSVPMTANFTLDNATSQVTLVLTGPSDRWFGLGIGIVSGFGMDAGDAVVFTTTTTPNLTDRNFIGGVNPPLDTTQNWTTVSNTVTGTVRTLTLTRALTTGDSNDFPLPYATTNSLSFGGVRATNATMSVGSHGGSASAGYAVNIPLVTLGVEDFTLKATQIYPNPSKGIFTVQSKTTLDKISVYSQTGVLVKSIEVLTNSSEMIEVSLQGLQTGVYLLELQNTTEKSWKKVVID